MELQKIEIQSAMKKGWLSLDQAAVAYTTWLVGSAHANCYGRHPRCTDFNCQNLSVALNDTLDTLLKIEQRSSILGLFAMHRPNWVSLFNAQYAFVDHSGELVVCNDYGKALDWLDLAPDRIAISDATKHSSNSQVAHRL